MSEKTKQPEYTDVASGGMTPAYDMQSEYAVGLLRECAETLQSLLDSTTGREDFWVTLVEMACSQAGCKFHLLASERKRGTGETRTVIHTNLNDKIGVKSALERLTSGLDLPSLFDRACQTHDGTFAASMTAGGEKAFCCAVKEVLFPLGNGEPRRLSLLLAVFDRSEPPDPAFPAVKFLTYDQFFLRTVLLHIALYVRREYWARVCSLAAARGGATLSGLRSPARALLEFECVVGLSPDLMVLEQWLEAEKDAFLRGESGEADFEKALGGAAIWLGQVDRRRVPKSLKQALFECYLAYLTKTGEKRRDMALLSQRIKQAERLARWRSIEGA